MACKCEVFKKAINTVRLLSADGVSKANSGHPGMPMGCADYAFTLWSEFLRFNPDDPEAEGFTPLQWYNMGYSPAIIPPDSERVYWAQVRCVDCTLEGGNKNKPADWPTTHE